MPTVIGLHEIELRPEVDRAEYERHFAEEVATRPMLPGWTARLLRGERGPRAGKYLVLLEMESVEAGDRYFPAEGQESAEFRRSWTSTPTWPRRGRSGEATRVPTKRRTTSS